MPAGVRFLPDQISKRKGQIAELTECLNELAAGLDVAAIVAEMFSNCDGAVRRWHLAGHFKL
jgi:hypothetical protein